MKRLLRGRLVEALSYEDISSAVRDAIRNTVSQPDKDGYRPWVSVEVFPGHAVYEKDGKWWKRSYTIGPDGVSLGADITQVTKAWVEVQREALRRQQGADRVTEMLTGALAGAVLESAEGQAPVLRGVTLIRAGESANRRVYGADMLKRDGSEVFENAPAYVTNHNPADKTIRNLVGAYKNVRWDEDAQALRADLHVVEANRGLVDTALQAAELLGADRVGLSIDTAGSFTLAGKGKAREVVKLHRTAQTSVDLVINPAAGGRLSEAQEGGDALPEEDKAMELEQIRERLRQILGAERVAEMTDEQVAQFRALAEAQEGGGSQETTPPAGENGSASEAQTPPPALTAEQVREIASQAVREQACAQLLESRLAGMGELEREAIRPRFEGRVFEASELDGEITRIRDIAGRERPNRPSVPGNVRVVTESFDINRARLETTVTRQPVEVNGRRVEPFRRLSEAVTAFHPEMAALYVSDPERAYATAQRMFRFAEAGEETTLDRALATESIETGTFTYAWADVLNRVLVAAAGDPDLNVWRRLVSRTIPFRDLTNAYKMIIKSDLGTLPVVNQGAPYQEVATYNTEKKQEIAAPSKRGGLYGITMEAMLLDDIGMLAEVPGDLQRAWSWTVYDVVIAAMQGTAGVGPTMSYDSTALYDAAGHGNLASSAFSATALKTGRLAMKKQTDPVSGKRKRFQAKYLCYAVDLEEAVFEALMSAFKITASAAEINLPNFIRERLGLEALEIDYPVATTTRWELVADPMTAPTIAAGFLFGRDAPSIVIADAATTGSMFAADTVVYKISGTVGAAPIDHRSFYRGNA